MKEQFTLIAPCHFGLEAVLKREIEDLGYEITLVEDGRVSFLGDAEAIALSNVFLRTAERILVQVGRFEARTWDELFEGTKALPWEDYIPADGKFWVTKAASVKSALFSPSDIQSIMKKAMVERLKARRNSLYIAGKRGNAGGLHGSVGDVGKPADVRRAVGDDLWFPETGDSYPVRVFLMKDVVTVGIDTTGDSLHKRGYRVRISKAPISETLAAALLKLTPWRGDRILVDPFCGCGTFVIEAAMMAADIAPGMNREFTAMNWENLVPKRLWYDAVDEANERAEEGLRELKGLSPDIQGYDIDGEVIKLARENAADAGVDQFIHFQQRDVAKLSHSGKYGFLVTNPPYGERIEERENLPELYGALGKALDKMDTWSAYVISSYDGVEKDMGRKAAKNRKLYNGMIKTYFYQFPGPKPPRREK